MDRLDIQHWGQPVDTAALTAHNNDAESSAAIGARVSQARLQQSERQSMPNGTLPASLVLAHCALEPAAATLMHRAAGSLQWSGRIFHRIQKISRTIADLADSPTIDAEHVAEAISMRRTLEFTVTT